MGEKDGWHSKNLQEFSPLSCSGKEQLKSHPVFPSPRSQSSHIAAEIVKMIQALWMRGSLCFGEPTTLYGF